MDRSIKPFNIRNLRSLPGGEAAIEVEQLDLLKERGVAEAEFAGRPQAIPIVPLEGL